MGPNRYLILVWYQSLGTRLPKVVFPRVDGWSTGTPGFWGVTTLYKSLGINHLGLEGHGFKPFHSLYILCLCPNMLHDCVLSIV